MPAYIHDLANNTLCKASLVPAVIRTVTANGTGVDLITADGLCHVGVVPGVITDGTHTISVQESDDNSTNWTSVTLVQSLTALTSATTSGAVQFATFQRSKRYVRAVTTVTGSPGTGGYYTVVILEPLKTY